MSNKKTGLSIVVPTFNRPDSLDNLLHYLSNQNDLGSEFEIIVVDDGSESDYHGVISKHQNLPLAFYKKEHKGPGAARNLGVELSSFSAVLFIDDDVIPTNGLVGQHMRSHQRNQPAYSILGATYFPTSGGEVMDRHEYPNGVTFRLSEQSPHFKDQQVLDYTWFITCNVSVDRERFLSVGGFDENFIFPNYEDIELGYKLEASGVQLIFSKEARAYHLNVHSFAERSRWAYQNGYSKGIMIGLHPELTDELIQCRRYGVGEKNLLEMRTDLVNEEEVMAKGLELEKALRANSNPQLMQQFEQLCNAFYAHL